MEKKSESKKSISSRKTEPSGNEAEETGKSLAAARSRASTSKGKNIGFGKGKDETSSKSLGKSEGNVSKKDKIPILHDPSKTALRSRSTKKSKSTKSRTSKARQSIDFEYDGLGVKGFELKELNMQDSSTYKSGSTVSTVRSHFSIGTLDYAKLFIDNPIKSAVFGDLSSGKSLSTVVSDVSNKASTKYSLPPQPAPRVGETREFRKRAASQARSVQKEVPLAARESTLERFRRRASTIAYRSFLGGSLSAKNSANKNMIFVLLFGEFVFAYSTKTIDSLITSAYADKLGFLPPLTIYAAQMQVIVGSFLGNFLGLLADLYFGKYQIFLCSTIIFSVLTTICFLASIPVIGKAIRVLLLRILVWSMWLYPMTNGVRSAFLAEQVSLLEDRQRIRNYFLYIILSRSLGDLCRTLLYVVITFFLSPYWNIGENDIWITKGAFITFLNSIYVGLFLLKRHEAIVYKSFWKSLQEYEKKSWPDRNVMTSNIKLRNICIIFLACLSYGPLTIISRGTFLDQFSMLYTYGLKEYKIPYICLEVLTITVFIIAFEVVIIPSARKHIKITDLTLIWLSALALLVSSTVCYIVQINIELSYSLPRDGYGMIRIYNAYPGNVSLKCDWFTAQIGYTELYHSSVSVVGWKNTTLSYSKDNFLTSENVSIHVQEARSISYLVSKGKIVRIKGYDSFIHGPVGTNDMNTPVTVVISVNETVVGEFMLLDTLEGEEVTTVEVNQYNERTFFSTVPGSYYIKFIGYYHNKTFVSSDRVLLRVGRSYTFIIFDHPKVIVRKYDLINLSDFHYLNIIPGELFLAIAMGLALVSMYNFCYTESPMQYRCIVFSYVTWVGTCGFGGYHWAKVHFWFLMASSFTIAVYLSIHVFLILLFLLLILIVKLH